MADKQAAALMVIMFLGQRAPNLDRTLDTVLSLKACKRADKGKWANNSIELLSYRIGGDTVVFPEKVPG